LLIQLNGESREVSEASMLSDLVRELSLAPARIAIEVNQQVARRDQWARIALAEGDRIEIVHFVGGGGVDGAPSRITRNMRVPPSP
jgi:thiamine biosynthesis protein ThiS